MVFDSLSHLDPAAGRAGSRIAVSTSSESPPFFRSSCNVAETIMDGSGSVGVRGLYLSVRWVGCGFDLADANAQLMVPQSPPCKMCRRTCPNCASHQVCISASSPAAVEPCHFLVVEACHFLSRLTPEDMLPAWAAYVSPSGLLPGLPPKALVATHVIAVTRLSVVAAKPVGPALTVVQVHETLLAVAANTAAGRWKIGALTSPVRNSSVLPSAYRTDGSPAGLQAALPCIPTCPLAAALAGLVLEMARTSLAAARTVAVHTLSTSMVLAASSP